MGFGKLVFENRDIDAPIQLFQRGSGKNTRFTVIYGQEVRGGLDYVTAAHQLGECLLHALACRGRIDNS